MKSCRVLLPALILLFASCADGETSKLDEVISEMGKAKTMDVPVPKDTTPVTTIGADSAHTILLDGNTERKFYVYHGNLDPAATEPPFVLAEYTLDGLQRYILSQKTKNAGDKGPVFIIKWGGNAKYNDVINVIDELKKCGFTNYALTKVSEEEFKKIAEKKAKKSL
jgi:hypothetical protein